jgi:dolichyl-phosphate beta-glucosyltransferase
MRDEMLNLSIVVPAFNEAHRITDRAGLLNEAAAAGDIDPSTIEVIVVDDGSTDETARLAAQLLSASFPRLRILQLHRNSGKGAAIRVGAAAAAAPFVAFMDADMSVDPAQIPLLMAAMEGADIAIGSRSMMDSTIESHSPHRIVMGRAFNFLANALTNVGLKDTQCGFKAFRTPVARILFHLMVVDRFAFDVDVLFLARRLGLQISEVPVEWREAGLSTVRPLSDSMTMTLDLFRIPLRRKRPNIPALVVETGPRDGEIVRLSPTFRSTDPIVPLSRDRALLLLPLCSLEEMNGAAVRLGPSATVQKRFVSSGELMEMMPLDWSVTNGGRTNPARNLWLERRHRSTEHVRQYADVGAQPLSRLEA